MAKKLYSHLIKPTIVRDGPPGLYPESMIWMEAKDMEGFNGHFAYGFIKEPGTLHPVEGMVVPPLRRGSGLRGLPRRRHQAHHEANISIVPRRRTGGAHLPPAHVRHHPQRDAARSGDCSLGGQAAGSLHHRPFPWYRADVLPRAPPLKVTSTTHLVKRLRCEFPEAPTKTMSGEEDKGPATPTSWMRTGSCIRRSSASGPGNGDHIVWLFGDNLEGFDVNFTWGYYSRCGKWHPGRGGPHSSRLRSSAIWDSAPTT